MTDEEWIQAYTAGHDDGFRKAVTIIEFFLLESDMNPMSSKWKALREFLTKMKRLDR